jgi:hypothetical protein
MVDVFGNVNDYGEPANKTNRHKQFTQEIHNVAFDFGVWECADVTLKSPFFHFLFYV